MSCWIEISALRLDVVVGINESEQKNLQPIVLEAKMNVPTLVASGDTGDLDQSINYSAVTKRLAFVAQHGQWGLLESLAVALCRMLLLDARCSACEVIVRKPDALKGVAVPAARVSTSRGSAISDVEARSVCSGVTLEVLAETPMGAAYSLRLDADSRWPLPLGLAAHVVSGRVTALSEDGGGGLELAAAGMLPRGASVILRAGHGGAHLVLAGQQSLRTHSGGMGSSARVRAFIALGSNLGDRAQHLTNALTAMGERCGVVGAVSQLYVTSPQHVADQPDFLNASCELHTSLSPSALLEALKVIEREAGRKATGEAGTVRYGPRPLDLDILLYGDEALTCDSRDGPLTIPHALMLQRSFVLAPLCDVAARVRHPISGRTILTEYAALCDAERRAGGPLAASASADLPQRVLPIRADLYWPLGSRTYVMGILNLTPDSFSDGGRGLDTDVRLALQEAEAMVRNGADVLDLGAESTRPGAERVSEEEEARRLLPVIRAIRAAPPPLGAAVVLSVDTTRAGVAAAAIAAGADVINDISGGTFDGDMIATAARLGVPLILMHTRGTPKTMRDLATYPEDKLCEVVCEELAACVRRAHREGIPPWRLVCDPGIGFAKTPAQSMQLLRELPKFLRQLCGACATPTGAWGGNAALVGGGSCCASLIGASRKGFIGQVLSQPDPMKRTFGNAATVCASVIAGADIVRVHEVDEMRQVAMLSDAIHRGSAPPSKL